MASGDADAPARPARASFNPCPPKVGHDPGGIIVVRYRLRKGTAHVSRPWPRLPTPGVACGDWRHGTVASDQEEEPKDAEEDDDEARSSYLTVYIHICHTRYTHMSFPYQGYSGILHKTLSGSLFSDITLAPGLGGVERRPA